MHTAELLSAAVAKSLYLIHRDGKGDTGRDLSAMLAFLSCRNSKHISLRSRSFLYPFSAAVAHFRGQQNYITKNSDAVH